MSHTHDEAELTAYALGESDPAGRKAVEERLAACEGCRKAVAETRALAGALSAELGREAGPGLRPAQRQALERRLSGRRALPMWLKAASVLAVAGVGGALAFHGLSPQKQGRHAGLVEAKHTIGFNRASPAQPAAPSPAVGDVTGLLAETKETLRVLAPRTGVWNLGVGGKHKEAAFGERVRNAVGWGEFKNEDDTAGHDTEAFDRIVDNAFLAVSQNPLSTFSIDVDTASYAILRRCLAEGRMPPKDAVRVEEMLNYFRYDYPKPEGEDPFSVNVEVAACPWEPRHRLVQIGLKGREVDLSRRPPSNLVFLLDVSGSMQPSDRLPLIQQALPLLVQQLGEKDRVAVVVYAGASGLVLPSTPCDRKEAILASLSRLQAGGSTNGGAGIELAYDTAVRNLIPGGTNRVILCTDGDWNVGVTNQGDLTRLIEEKAKLGVFLSVLGFGMGNTKDSTMEKLADRGNGNYAYIDTLKEAHKVLVEQMAGTLITIAKDVKIQVEFNPAKAAGYRLVGYENRMLRKEDFNDDRKDAGEIGSGHTVTALYEVVPAGQDLKLPGVDPLKYQTPADPASGKASEELLTVKLRAKAPEGEASRLTELPVKDAGTTYEKASGDFRFAAAVASFGMLLRDSEHKGNAGYDSLLEHLGREEMGRDEGGYRTEFVELVKAARRLAGTERVNPGPPLP